tara:strand:- start:883 stop:1017 length:135 start_codon:yes stop_codon:yes gene_type:complete
LKKDLEVPFFSLYLCLRKLEETISIAITIIKAIAIKNYELEITN